MIDFKPEVKKVNFTCTNCGNTLLIIHNMILPVYFTMGIKCPGCDKILDGTMVQIYRSEPDFDMMNRLQDPEKFI
jgi:hypothetical protein